MTQEKVFKTVINKAWDDDNYRKQLISSPAEAIKSATGYDIPNGARVVVTDQTDASVVYVNIPAKPDFASMELTDEQLEQVAGGELAVTAVASALIGSASLSYTIGGNSGW